MTTAATAMTAAKTLATIAGGPDIEKNEWEIRSTRFCHIQTAQDRRGTTQHTRQESCKATKST